MALEAFQLGDALVEAAPGALNQGSTPVVFALTIGDGATTNMDWTLPNFAIRIVDGWAVKTAATAAASANTLQLRTGAGVPASDQLNMQVADTTLVRVGQIDDANHAFAAGATLRVRRVKAGENAAAIFYVQALRT